MKMTMKKLTAICMATIVSMCSLALQSSGTGERNLLVHAASADDLTFEIITLNKGQVPDFTSDKPYSDWKYYLPVNEELSSSEPYCFAVVTKCSKYAAGTLEIPAEYGSMFCCSIPRRLPANSRHGIRLPGIRIRLFNPI